MLTFSLPNNYSKRWFNRKIIWIGTSFCPAIYSLFFSVDMPLISNSRFAKFCIYMKTSWDKLFNHHWYKRCVNCLIFILGQYCIYKQDACPKGLTEGYIFFDDENHKNVNKVGGTLPDGVYDKDTKIFYCCRTDGNKLEPISLPVMSPFYLMAYNTSECQRVKGALATKEYIRHDNEDTKNKDAMNGTHPFEQGKANITIMYCYYEGKHCDKKNTHYPAFSQSQRTLKRK